MVNNYLVTRDYLDIFNVISTQGKSNDGIRELNGIRAWHDFDGYTCWLAYKDLTVTLYFHSKLQVEYDKDGTMTEFLNLFKMLTAR